MIGILLVFWACETVQESTHSIDPQPSTQKMQSSSTSRPTSFELPPPARDLHRATGSRVQFQNVEGYLARRSDETAGLALLLLGDSLSPNHQYRARQLADSSALVFLISSDIDADSARVYVEGMEGVTQVQITRILNEVPPDP